MRLGGGYLISHVRRRNMKLTMRGFYLACLIAAAIAAAPMPIDTFQTPPTREDRSKADESHATRNLPKTRFAFPTRFQCFLAGAGVFSAIGLVREIVMKRRGHATGPGRS